MCALILTLGLAGFALTGMAGAETVTQGSFVGDISHRALEPLKDGSAMSQVFVSVSLTSGGAPSSAQMPDALRFALRTGCANGTSLATIQSGRDAASVTYEILCKGGR